MIVFDQKISVSNIIQIGVILVTILAAWFVLDGRVTANDTELELLLDDLDALKVSEMFINANTGTRIRLLELAEARSDERLKNILDVVEDNKDALMQVQQSISDISR